MSWSSRNIHWPLFIFQSSDGDSWTQWGSWTPCSATCGRGRRARRRTCQSQSIVSSVILRDAESSCPGAGEEIDQCSSSSQCVASSTDSRRKWSSWGQFNSCSSSCAGGVRLRLRTCEGTRGQCYGSPSDVQPCGHSQCPLAISISNGSYVTVIIGGWREDWLQNVTFLHSDGRWCSGPDLPIWLADHFSVLVGFRIMTCGGRSNDGNTLCWFLNMDGNKAVWTRTSE